MTFQAKNLKVQDWENPVCLNFFQASSGRERDQNKGLLPVLYFKVFVSGSALIVYQAVLFSRNSFQDCKSVKHIKNAISNTALICDSDSLSQIKNFLNPSPLTLKKLTFLANRYFYTTCNDVWLHYTKLDSM